MTRRHGWGAFGGVLAVALLFGAKNVSGHHSFAVYDAKNLVDIQGTVTRVNWANPHASLYLDHQNKAGAAEQWVFEMHSPNDLTRYGWRRDTLKPGDVVTVHGARERSGSNRAFLFWATFPDGRKVLTDNLGVPEAK